MRAHRLCASAATAFAVALVAGCADPMTTRVHASPEPVLQAGLELSDSVATPGAEVRVGVRLRGSSAGTVASFTARLAYDAAGLRYLDEVSLGDSATRVINPQPGMLRLAAIAPAGFRAGRLYEVRFAVLRPGALSSLRLTMEELHTTTRADALPTLTGAP